MGGAGLQGLWRDEDEGDPDAASSPADALETAAAADANWPYSVSTLSETNGLTFSRSSRNRYHTAVRLDMAVGFAALVVFLVVPLFHPLFEESLITPPGRPNSAGELRYGTSSLIETRLTVSREG